LTKIDLKRDKNMYSVHCLLYATSHKPEDN